MNPEILGTELIHTMVQTGQALITSPAVQGVVSSLITTLFIRRGEKIKVLEALKEKEFEADEEYTLLCLKDMKNGNPAFYVGAFQILPGGSNIDLLEDN